MILFDDPRMLFHVPGRGSHVARLEERRRLAYIQRTFKHLSTDININFLPAKEWPVKASFHAAPALVVEPGLKAYSSRRFADPGPLGGESRWASSGCARIRVWFPAEPFVLCQTYLILSRCLCHLL